MSKIYLEKGKVIIDALQGQEIAFTLSSTDIVWADFTELAIDFKRHANMNERPIMRVEIGSGLVIEVTKLHVTVAESKTENLPYQILYWDLKGKQGGKTVAIMPGELRIDNSVTKLQ